jgi:quinol monooxygenase YgiN
LFRARTDRRLERVDAASVTLFVFVRLHSRLGNEDKVRTALTMVVTASRTEPGCVSIHAFQSSRDPRRFFIHSVWKDADAFDGHAKLPHTLDFMETVDGLLDEPREVIRTSRIA